MLFLFYFKSQGHSTLKAIKTESLDLPEGSHFKKDSVQRHLELSASLEIEGRMVGPGLGLGSVSWWNQCLVHKNLQFFKIKGSRD